MSPITVGIDNEVPQSFARRIGSLDLSEFLRLGPDDGFDPAGSEYLAPHFAESPLEEGSALAHYAVGNKELVDPLILNAASKDALHALIRTIERELRKPGLQVEWRDAGASESTFFDLEAGVLQHQFHFRRSQVNHANATLRLWVRPYGHTGSERLVGSAQGAGPLVTAELPAGALEGDVPALLDASVTADATVTAPGRIVALSVLPDPDYTARFAAQAIGDRMTGTTVVADATAAGGEYLGLPIAAQSVGTIVAKLTLPDPGLYAGASRVLALARAKVANGVALRAYDPMGFALGRARTVLSGDGWQLVDLGVLRLGSVEAAKVSIHAAGLGGTTVSEPRFHLNECYVLPEPSSALVTEDGAVDLATLGVNPAAGDVYRFDGVRGRTWRETVGGTLTAQLGVAQRGRTPRLHLPDAVVVAALVAAVTPSAANGPVELDVRAREQWSYAR